jgi:hypothetical protein
MGDLRHRGWRMPVLAVYVLVLLGSPLGEAGLLGLHLLTEHGHRVGGATERESEPVVMVIGQGSVLEAIASGDHPQQPRRRESGGARTTHDAKHGASDATPEQHHHPGVSSTRTHPHSHVDEPAPLTRASKHSHDTGAAHGAGEERGTLSSGSGSSLEENGLATPAASAGPHEHAGVVHTHEGNTDGELGPYAGSISEFYLSPDAFPESPPTPVAGDLTTLLSETDQRIAPVEPPPPRLPS